jgi:hypothetical protein
VGPLPQQFHGDAFAGHEFPPERLPPKYRKQGLRFTDTGYPDFEPYAMVLPNGQKKSESRCRVPGTPMKLLRTLSSI